MEISSQDIKEALKKAKSELSEEEKKKRRTKRIAGLALLGLSLLGMPFIPQLMSKINAPAASAKLPSQKAAAQKSLSNILKKLPKKKEAPKEEKPAEAPKQETKAPAPAVNVAKAAADQPLQSLRIPFNTESRWANYAGGASAITYNNVGAGGGTVTIGVEGGSFIAQGNDTYFVYGEFGSIEAIQQQNVKYPQWDQRHGAIDFAAKMGTEVVAAAGGKVVYVGQFEGNSVIVDVGGGYYTTYSHLATMDVTVGQKINAGDRIGTVGNSGTTNPHLHFEVDRVEGSTVWAVNPHKFFNAADYNKIIKVDAPANRFYAGDRTNAEAQPDFEWNAAWKGYFLAAVGK
jgi:murein DD-endopeptidase MepM/ murein hydrolase activator NlpD